MDRRTTNGCADAISSSTNAGRLVIDGFCLILIVLLFWLWIRARARTSSVNQLLPWYTFGVLLALTAIYLILGIIITVLGSCSSIGSLTISGLSVPASLTSGSANLLLLGIIALPLTQQMLQYRGYPKKIVVIVNMSGVSIAIIIFIPTIILSNMASISRFSPGLPGPTRTLVASLGTKFSLAYYTAYFGVALVASIILGHASLRAAPAMLMRQKKRRKWVYCTIISLLIGSGSAVIQMYTFTLPERKLPPTAWVSFLAIFNVSFILTIFAVFQAAQTIVLPVVDPMDNATYDPDASEETQPAIHKRFTYTRSTEIGRPADVYTSENVGWPLNSPKSPKWLFTSPTRSTFGLGHQTPRIVQHAF